MREEIYIRDRFHCRYCHVYISPTDQFHADHVIPFSRGGPTTMANLVLACVTCNLRKGAKSWDLLPVFPVDIDQLPAELADDMRAEQRRKHAAARGHALQLTFAWGTAAKKRRRKRHIPKVIWRCSCGAWSRKKWAERSKEPWLDAELHLATVRLDVPTDEEVEEFAISGAISRPPWL